MKDMIAMLNGKNFPMGVEKCPACGAERESRFQVQCGACLRRCVGMDKPQTLQIVIECQSSKIERTIET